MKANNQHLLANEQALREANMRLEQAVEKEQAKSKELKIFYDASIGREERIMELKKEVAKLKEELGRRLN